MATRRASLSTGKATKTRPGLVRNAFNKVSTLPAYQTLTEQFKRR